MANQLDENLNLYRISCPIGLILVIFEARPEVVVQISCLCLKSGNSVILKGGKDASRSNIALFDAIQAGIAATSGTSILPGCVQLVSSRDQVSDLLSCNNEIDLVIPRGSNALVQHIKQSTTIPVLGHADGICSIFVNKDADCSKALRVIVDSKTNYPAACNAVEKLLVDRSIDPSTFLDIIAMLVQKNVTMFLCPSSFSQATAKFPSQAGKLLVQAQPSDFTTEFSDMKIAIKFIANVEDAVSEINNLGSHHTDCILTENAQTAELFMQQVDSAGVYWNASTRFADGFRYGFGAEIGVSTNKTHARGPVGLEGLTIYKYRLIGDGHIVAEYNDGTRNYNRKSLV